MCLISISWHFSFSGSFNVWLPLGKQRILSVLLSWTIYLGRGSQPKEANFKALSEVLRSRERERETRKENLDISSITTNIFKVYSPGFSVYLLFTYECLSFGFVVYFFPFLTLQTYMNSNKENRLTGIRRLNGERKIVCNYFPFVSFIPYFRRLVFKGYDFDLRLPIPTKIIIIFF